MRDSGHDFASQRGNDGQNHDGENDSGGEHSKSEIRLGEDTTPAKGANQEWVDVLAEDWHQNENGPKAINHAGDSRQKFGEKGERRAQEPGAHLGNENR